MRRALLMSLGGSPEPLAVSICGHRPEWVFFLASQDSVVKLKDVVQGAAERGCEFAQELELVDDPANLLECYEKASALADRALAKGFQADEVIVDYTGGTKTMTAAMALAALGKGFQFAYVSGSRRTKGGLGVVESGAEEIRHSVSPWQFFAVEERKRLQMLFNTHQYRAAEDMARELEVKQRYEESVFYRIAALAASGYGQWDLFNHIAAERALAKALEEFEKIPELSPPRKQRVYSFRDQLVQHKEVLTAALEQRGRKDLPSRFLILDLLANAERRASEGRFDDAVARLYRTLEMIAQLALWEGYKVKTDRVPVDFVPESLREEFSRYMDDESGKYKVPLFAAYRLLLEKGDPVGKSFAGLKGELLKVLDARNSSILAHGTQPLRPNTYEKLRDMVLQFARAGREELVAFPELTLW